MRLSHPTAPYQGIPPQDVFFVANDRYVQMGLGFVIPTMNTEMYPDKPLEIYLYIEAQPSARDLLLGALLGRAEQMRARFPGVPAGILGHSEGGAVALLAAAADSGARFVVLLAAPAAPVRMNVLAQTEIIHRTNNMDEAQIAREVALLTRVFDVLASGAPFESLRADFRQKARADIAAMSDEMRRALSDTDQYGDVLFRQMEAMMDTPWFRSLLAFDAAAVLPKVSCPIFAAFGERDLQVAPRVNNARLADLLSSRPPDSVRIFTYPHANHLFQEAVSGSPVEYRTLKSEYVPGLMDDITAWIGERIVRQQ